MSLLLNITKDNKQKQADWIGTLRKYVKDTQMYEYLTNKQK